MGSLWRRRFARPLPSLAGLIAATIAVIVALASPPLDAQTTPTATVAGRVYHDEQPPVPAVGAQLGIFEVQADGSRGTWIADTFTDTDGAYALAMEPGAYMVTFIAPDGASFAPGNSRYRSRSVAVSSGEIAVVDGVLNPRGEPGVVSGRVVDNGTEPGPIADQRLGIFTMGADGSRGRWLGDTFTDADGAYRFAMPAGLYVITFIAPEGTTFVDSGTPYLSTPVELTSGGSATVTAVVARQPGQDLPRSGPIVVDTPGAVVDGLHVTATGATAVLVTAPDVTLRNLFVEHSDGPGIRAVGADRLVIEDVRVDHVGAPATGPHDSDGENNIEIEGSARVVVERVRVSRGSSGIYLVGSPDSVLRQVEGHDFRGPFPRGQLVQWNASDRGLLEDFSVINPPGSWPEDNVNVFRSRDVVIRRGLVDGNNSPSGVGVIFDGDTATGRVEDVDAIRMGNGCFSNYAGAGATFVRTRCGDNICDDQGRGAPLSGALMWAGNPNGTSRATIVGSVYANSCNGNLVWPEASFDTIDLIEADFTPRAPIELSWPWSAD